jgi:transcriptional regulator with XRE-family HTH domain
MSKLSKATLELRAARKLGESHGSRALAAWLSSSELTQRDVAEALGTTTQMVQHWMRGRHTPSLVIAVRIRDLAGIPVESWTERAVLDGGVHEQEKTT